MTVIVCVDEQGGILFNHRRVSTDRAVISDILDYVDQHPLRVREYSVKLFPEDTALCVGADYLSGAGKGDYVFLEDAFPDELWEKAESVVVYHWGRLYPSDVKFPFMDLRDRGRLESSSEFTGNSHSKITREVYAL